MKKKTIVFFSFFLLSLLINIIPVFIFRDKAHFSHISIYAVEAMFVVSTGGIWCYFVRHKENYLSFSTIRKYSIIYGPDREITFTKEFKRRFYWQFVVYWSAIPFYIPCIFFSTKLIHSLWTVGVVFAPQIIYFTYYTVKLKEEFRKRREARLKLKQELEEQKKREELGYYK